jgi:hypothetical protein
MRKRDACPALKMVRKLLALLSQGFGIIRHQEDGWGDTSAEILHYAHSKDILLSRCAVASLTGLLSMFFPWRKTAILLPDLLKGYSIDPVGGRRLGCIWGRGHLLVVAHFNKRPPAPCPNLPPRGQPSRGRFDMLQTPSFSGGSYNHQ